MTIQIYFRFGIAWIPIPSLNNMNKEDSLIWTRGPLGYSWSVTKLVMFKRNFDKGKLFYYRCRKPVGDLGVLDAPQRYHQRLRIGVPWSDGDRMIAGGDVALRNSVKMRGMMRYSMCERFGGYNITLKTTYCRDSCIGPTLYVIGAGKEALRHGYVNGDVLPINPWITI